MFSENKVAGLDFQYTGYGLLVKDLAMFIVCSVTLEVDNLANGIQAEQNFLNYYYDCLSKEIELNFTKEVLFRQYELALMDLTRFLAGWGPWGNY